MFLFPWILLKHDDDVKEEKSKSKSLTNTRKMNDVDAVANIKKKRKMNNMSKQQQEEMSKLYGKSSKRKRNHTVPYVVNRNKRRNMMLNYTTRHQARSSSNNDVYKAIRYLRKRKMNYDDKDEILSKNKRNNLGKAKTTDDEVHNTGCSIIKIGDTVDLSDLLFTKQRNFLIRSNQQRVEAKDLSGKFVVLYFMALTPYNDHPGTLSKHLLDIYDKLQPRGDFEIVLVAIHDHVPHHLTPDQFFLKSFSVMPWLAIPSSDLKSRKRLESIFCKDNKMPCCIIIDPTGVILQCDANPLFLRYGAAAYPFTNERIQSIDSEDNLLMQQPLSIQKLLATAERDYLINNNGDQVPLDGLDHKVVGLYYCPCLDEEHTLTEMLKNLYQELSKNKKEFEIALIHTHDWCNHGDTCRFMVEDSFLNEIKKMPWLTLPFKDTDCTMKLQRIFQHPKKLGVPGPPRLVIVGPHGKFVEPFGIDILLSYGAPAYPFSFRSAVNLELEMLKKLKLEMLWDLDTVFMHTNGSQVRFSQYIGKRIIVLFQNDTSVFNDFWREMKARYIRMKGTDDEFEVIHISMGVYIMDTATPFPWFMPVYLDRDSYAGMYVNRVWPDFSLKNCGLLAFDRDGSVVRIKKDPKLGDNMVFPFYQNGDMENEVLLHVREYLKCDLER